MILHDFSVSMTLFIFFSFHDSFFFHDCGNPVSSTYSSRRTVVKKLSPPFVGNDLIVLLFNQLGLGHTAMKKFSIMFGWEGHHLKTFQRKESRVTSTIIDNTEEVLTASVSKVREAYLHLDPTASKDPLCITVSFDGSCISVVTHLCMALLL